MSEPTHVLGMHLPNGATVTHVAFEELPDGSTVEEMHDSHDNHTRTFTPAPGSPAEIRAKIEKRLRDALVDNATWSREKVMGNTERPFTAGEAAGILLSQINGLIRILLNDYETDDFV